MQGKEGGPGDFQAVSPGRAPLHFTSQKDLVSWTPEAFQSSVWVKKCLLREASTTPLILPCTHLLPFHLLLALERGPSVCGPFTHLCRTPCLCHGMPSLPPHLLWPSLPPPQQRIAFFKNYFLIV